MSAEHRIIRLAPLGGLDGSRISDEGTLDAQRPVPMRGGYNVQVIDGEWWCRPGYSFADATRQKFGSVPWWWMVGTSSNFDILASPWYALRWQRSGHTVREAYTPRIASEAITFTLGSATATSTSTLVVGDGILTGTSGGTTQFYVAVGVSGTTVTLDRVAEVNGATNCRIIDSITGTSPFTGNGGASTSLAAYALIDQLVTHSLYSGAVVTTAGKQYMIITSDLAAPVAFRTDGPVALVQNWFRDTSVAAPSAKSDGLVCAEHQNRLLIGRAGDPDGNYAEKTVWWSLPGDFVQFHSGVAGQTGIPFYKTFGGTDNVDSIRAIAPLGENVVVHRRRSQEVGSPQGSASAPYRWTRLNEGAGIIGSRAYASFDRTHLLVTDRGLEMFDGGTFREIAPSLRRHIESMAFWRQVAFTVIDPDNLLLYLVPSGAAPTRHQEAAIPATATVTPVAGDDWQSATPVLVYDFRRDTAWFEDHVAISGAGTIDRRFYWLRFDGTILIPFDDRDTGLDQGVTTGTHVVDALVDTPWLGMETRHRLHKVVIGFRALDLTTGGAPSITDLWSATTDTLHLATVEVYTEGDITTPVVSQDLSKLVSEMLALEPDENQQMPLMDLEARHLDAAGTSFKLRIKNALSAAATTAGHKKGLFRIAYIEMHVVATESGIPGVPDPAP